MAVFANDSETFILPIVYIKKAYVFNVDFNYLVQSIADWSGIDQIRKDFLLLDFENEANSAHAMFLIKGIFEYFYGLVWLVDKINTSKYSGGIVKIKPHFFNITVLKNGDHSALLLAVPFSKSALKSLLPRNVFVALLWLSKKRYQQLAFGHAQYLKLDLKTQRDLKKF